eukprot:3273885-Rhodomonas_salina.2
MAAKRRDGSGGARTGQTSRRSHCRALRCNRTPHSPPQAGSELHARPLALSRPPRTCPHPRGTPHAVSSASARGQLVAIAGLGLAQHPD